MICLSSQSLLFIQKSHHENPVLNLAGTDVRRPRQGRMPLIPFVLRCTHAGRSQDGFRRRGGARALRESPWGLLFYWALNAYCNSCRPKLVMSGKTCCWTSNHPKSPSDLHITTGWSEPRASIERWTIFFFLWGAGGVLILFEDFKSQTLFFCFLLKALIRPTVPDGVRLSRRLPWIDQGIAEEYFRNIARLLKHKALCSC